MTTTEMNIVIAAFMGYTTEEIHIDQTGGRSIVNVSLEECGWISVDFHSSWDWLIPVWFKCQAIIRQNPDYRKYDSLFYGAMRREKIEECHKVVFDFIIEWRSKEETKTL